MLVPRGEQESPFMYQFFTNTKRVMHQTLQCSFSLHELLCTRQELTPQIPGKSLESQPELTGSGRPRDDLFLSALEFFHIPSGEDELALKELSFWRRNPDKKVRG